jgi:t-SNARE complex subunit (syntaxin)
LQIISAFADSSESFFVAYLPSNLNVCSTDISNKLKLSTEEVAESCTYLQLSIQKAIKSHELCNMRAKSSNGAFLNCDQHLVVLGKLPD